jgi:CheY-like chemotaxis protein
VLVVEDEPLLLLVAGDIVEDARLEPIFARNADEAILVLESRDDVKIVFTDVRMPGSMDGIRLAGAVRDRWLLSSSSLSPATCIPTRSCRTAPASSATLFV